jgi:hypothetical protein
VHALLGCTEMATLLTALSKRVCQRRLSATGPGLPAPTAAAHATLPHLQSPQVTLPVPLHSGQGGSAMAGLKVGTPRCVCTGSGPAAAGRCGSGKMGFRMREPCCRGGAKLVLESLLLLLGSSNRAAGRHKCARLCRRHGVPLSHGCGRGSSNASMMKVIRHN